ncbi:MAG: succinyldiaminopimelate transaminase [Helicobacteraceae bacterium]|nr:succinyldiaminopimelate transaminase [Helicobacteraceae bacterium]
MTFEPYPFEKLTTLLDGIEPNSKYTPIALTIGEPQFETPAFIQDELKNSSALLNKYPKTAGEVYLKESMKNFFDKRFNIELKNSEIIPTFGTREVLFNFPQFALFEKSDPVMAFTNPFYQIYEGSAIASRAKMHFLNLNESNAFKPELNEEVLKECDLVILNFPNNPTASVLSVEELSVWVEMALKHDFILLNDECYSEIYTDIPPPSLLEASKKVGNDNFKNMLVINSISKRSSAPGLRSGFIAGDENILKAYIKYRTYIGCASPLPLQKASSVAWSDEVHVEASRKVYAENFKIAQKILGFEMPKATFYIWLKVTDALEFTKNLYKEYNVKVLPGEFLARDNESGENPGKDYIRIALVETPKKVEEALIRVKKAMK